MSIFIFIFIENRLNLIRHKKLQYFTSLKVELFILTYCVNSTQFGFDENLLSYFWTENGLIGIFIENWSKLVLIKNRLILIWSKISPNKFMPRINVF